VVYYTFL